AQQIDRDVPLVHPLGHLPGAEGLDRGEQRLAEPHVGRRLRDGVAGELAAGAADRGEQDRGADEPEDDVGEDPGGGGHPVGRVLAERRCGDRPVRGHPREPSHLCGGPQGRGGPAAHRSGAPGTGRAYCEAMTSPNTQAATDPTTRLTAVVTGASSGIGRATAQRLVADGWRVLAVARREDRLRALAEETGCATLGVDVTDDASVAALAERARELFGETLNAVVHVAGGALGVDPVAEADLDRWQGMYATNVLGALRVTRALLPALRRSGRGDVLFVTSVAAHEAYPGGSGYNAA